MSTQSKSRSIRFSEKKPLLNTGDDVEIETFFCVITLAPIQHKFQQEFSKVCKN